MICGSNTLEYSRKGMKNKTGIDARLPPVLGGSLYAVLGFDRAGVEPLIKDV